MFAIAPPVAGMLSVLKLFIIPVGGGIPTIIKLIRTKLLHHTV